MTVITTRLTVRPDGSISAGTALPEGEYIASIQVGNRPPRQLPPLPFDTNALPVHDLGPWPEEISLRREDLYGDEGR